MYQNHLTVAGGSHLPSRGGSRNASRGGSLNPSRSGSRNASRNASRECSPSVSRRGSHNASTRRKGANRIIIFYFSLFSSFVYICAINSLLCKIFPEHYQIDKQFGSRSRSKLFAMVIRRSQSELPVEMVVGTLVEALVGIVAHLLQLYHDLWVMTFRSFHFKRLMWN